MIPISAGLAAHYKQGTTTLAMCWRIVLEDGSVYGFTSHDSDLYIDGVTYYAATGMTPSAIVGTSTMAPENMEVQSVLNSEFITEDDLNAGRWDYAEVYIFEVNYNKLSDGPLRLARGRIGEVTARRADFTAELRGLTDAYSRMIGELFGPACRANLGDARCKVDLSQFTVTGTIETVSPDGRVITDSARTEAGPEGGKPITAISQAKRAVVTCAGHGFVSGQLVFISGIEGVTQQDLNSINGRNYVISVVDNDRFSIPVDTRTLSTNADNGPTDPALVYSVYAGGGTVTPSGNVGHFTYGLLTMTSGANMGRSMEVAVYVPGLVTLRLSFPYPLAVGDTYAMSAGCGKRFIEDCKGKFQNGDNFRGEPFIPGMDQIMIFGGQNPGQEGTFSGQPAQEP